VVAIAPSVEKEMMELNKKELRKLLLDFNSISSRMMRVNYHDYDDVLRKFLSFIETQPVINDFIVDCGPPSYEVADEVKQVTQSYKMIFELGIIAAEEVSNIYHILKYCSQYQIGIPSSIGNSYSSSNKYQDMSDAFNHRVVYILTGHIRKYLEKIGVDMGIDENVKYSITVNNGQVNLANDQATINATMNNGVDMPTLITLISEVKQTLSDEFSTEEQEEVNDSLETIKEELSKNSPRKGLVKTALKGLTSFSNKSVQFAAAVATIGSFVMQLPGIGQ
jgi:hypothetical protein